MTRPSTDILNSISISIVDDDYATIIDRSYRRYSRRSWLDIGGRPSIDHRSYAKLDIDDDRLNVSKSASPVRHDADKSSNVFKSTCTYRSLVNTMTSLFTSIISTNDSSSSKHRYSMASESYVDNDAKVADALKSIARCFSKQCKSSNKAIESMIDRLGRNSSMLPTNQLRDIVFTTIDERSIRNDHACRLMTVFDSNDIESISMLADICVEMTIASSHHRYLDYWTTDTSYTINGRQHSSFKSACLSSLISIDKRSSSIDDRLVAMLSYVDKSSLIDRMTRCVAVIDAAIDRHESSTIVSMIEIVTHHINHKYHRLTIDYRSTSMTTID